VRRVALVLWTGFSLLALVAVWRWAPPQTPPLYDGVCVSNPYEFVDPPAGAPTTVPRAARHAVDVSQGVVPGTLVRTGELPDQASVSTDDGTVRAAGATKVTFTIDPIHAPKTLPADGVLDSNVYRLGASADNGAKISVDPTKPATITLRAANATGQLDTVEYLNNGVWTPLATTVVSCGFAHAAAIVGFGDYALVTPRASSQATPGATPQPNGGGDGGTGLPVPLIVAAVTAIALGIGIILLRRRNLARASASRRR